MGKNLTEATIFNKLLEPVNDFVLAQDSKLFKHIMSGSSGAMASCPARAMTCRAVALTCSRLRRSNKGTLSSRCRLYSNAARGEARIHCK